MTKYLSPIDPHVHLRWREYPDNFLELGFKDAVAVGLSALLEQPNTTPQLITEETIKERIKQAEKHKKEIEHRIHIGITNDFEQVKRALALIMSNTHNLVSDKTFYVHSTGEMGILDEDSQKRIWEIKRDFSYNGVSIGHFEDESKFNGKFDYENPITHSLRQPPESELAQVQKQIKNAFDAGFKGVFYIAHVSNPYTIDFIEKERNKLPFVVVLEATFHHIFLNTDDYKIHGNLVKMNPPLREPKMQEALLNRVIDGKVQVIGTDHAPHPLEKKKSSEPPSGIPTISFWPKGVELLRGHGMHEICVQDMLFYNSNRIFKLNLSPKEIDIEYNPSRWHSYGYNPFSRVDGSVSNTTAREISPLT